MHASIDAERTEEQVEGAAHHHPPVGVSSVSEHPFILMYLCSSRASSYEESEGTTARARSVCVRWYLRNRQATTTASRRGT